MKVVDPHLFQVGPHRRYRFRAVAMMIDSCTGAGQVDSCGQRLALIVQSFSADFLKDFQDVPLVDP